MEEKEEIKQENDGRRGPLIWILAMFLILIALALVVPSYVVKLDPEPKNIPSLAEVSSLDFESENMSNSIDKKEDILRFLNANDKVIKGIADRVVAQAECGGVKACYAKALLYFVRQEIEYVNDPPLEYVKGPRETLINGAGDCDDQAVLLANLLNAIGIETRFVFIPGHVYVEGYLPEALARYRDGGWVAMDATCQYCEFGEISYKSSEGDKEYV